jgi:SAM-dependent methyltransferase
MEKILSLTRSEFLFLDWSWPMNPFDKDYSKLYDTFHHEKNYSDEVLEVLRIVGQSLNKESEILDFGCGSGLHIREFLRRGFKISGYDPSEFMIKEAQKNNPLSQNIFSNLTPLEVRFDLVYSLFDVINYQHTEVELNSYVESIASKLKIGGTVLIDGWHLPGVLQNPPKMVEKEYLKDGLRIRRVVTPQPSDKENLFPLEIRLVDMATNEVFSSQIHIMRAFSKGEIQSILNEKGFGNLEFFDGKKYGHFLELNSWKFVVKATKILEQ